MRSAKDTLARLRRERENVEKLARDNGLLRFRLETQKADAQEHQSSQARKIIRQARVIKRLEERLRAAGQRPYEGAKIEETSTGAEYDAAGEA